MLTENSFNGGAGYTYEQVRNMTLNQIHHRLCEMDLLKKFGERSRKYALDEVPTILTPDEDGMIAGRDADGNPIKKKFKVGGKSLVRRLMEQAAAKREAEKTLQKKQRGKKKRKR